VDDGGDIRAFHGVRVVADDVGCSTEVGDIGENDGDVGVCVADFIKNVFQIGNDGIDESGGV